MMYENQVENKFARERFLAELDKRIEKALFKSVLKGTESVYLDDNLRLIVPIIPMTNLFAFATVLQNQKGAEWIEDTRHQTTGAVAYKGEKLFDILDSDAFYLYNGWSIYPKFYKNIQCAGWTEMDEHQNLIATYTCFIPMGIYGEGSYIEITRDDNVERKNLPYYDTDPGYDKNVDYIIMNTTFARKIEYCHPSIEKRGETIRYSIPETMGYTVDKFTTRGQTIRFNAVWVK